MQIEQRWGSGSRGLLDLVVGKSRVSSSSPNGAWLFFGTWAIPFTPLCQYFSEETFKKPLVPLSGVSCKLKYPHME